MAIGPGPATAGDLAAPSRPDRRQGRACAGTIPTPAGSKGFGTLASRAFAFVRALKALSREGRSKELLALAALYRLTPAGSLPAFLPGFEAGSAHVHARHALGALIVALVLFAFAWLQGRAPGRS